MTWEQGKETNAERRTKRAVAHKMESWDQGGKRNGQSKKEGRPSLVGIASAGHPHFNARCLGHVGGKKIKEQRRQAVSQDRKESKGRKKQRRQSHPRYTPGEGQISWPRLEAVVTWGKKAKKERT